MTTALWIIGLLAVGAGVWLVWVQFFAPLLDLREALRDLASGEYRVRIVRKTPWLLRRAAGDLDLLREQLTAQKRQLADEGFSLRAILGSMIEGIAIVDPSLHIRLANDAVQTMFDLKQSPMNRSVMEVFRDHEIQKALQRSLREERAIGIEFQTDSRIEMGSPVRYFKMNVAPLIPGGADGPAGLLVVFADVTEVRTLEAVRREFVANVSHEFRTPLAIISGYLETLLDGARDDPDMTERSLKIMQKHAVRLNLLIDDLLTISKLEHRSLPMIFRATDLREIIGRVIDQLEGTIESLGATVELDFEDRASIADVDSKRIEQVIFNLAANSLQYGKKSGGQVKITGRRKGDEIEVTVTDDGPGIPYEDQPHIFERFYRVHKDRSRDAGGTGLGLSIVKNVALAHHGHVSLRSTPGFGASFKVTLPVNQPVK